MHWLTWRLVAVSSHQWARSSSVDTGSVSAWTAPVIGKPHPRTSTQFTPWFLWSDFKWAACPFKTVWWKLFAHLSKSPSWTPFPIYHPGPEVQIYACVLLPWASQSIHLSPKFGFLNSGSGAFPFQWSVFWCFKACLLTFFSWTSSISQDRQFLWIYHLIFQSLRWLYQWCCPTVIIGPRFDRSSVGSCFGSIAWLTWSIWDTYWNNVPQKWPCADLDRLARNRPMRRAGSVVRHPPDFWSQICCMTSDIDSWSRRLRHLIECRWQFFLWVCLYHSRLLTTFLHFLHDARHQALNWPLPPCPEWRGSCQCPVALEWAKTSCLESFLRRGWGLNAMSYWILIGSPSRKNEKWIAADCQRWNPTADHW